MHKFLKTVVITLLIVISSQQAAFAAEKQQRPTKPTTGVESGDPNHGSSKDIPIISSESAKGLLIDWSCEITKDGAKLIVDGSSTSAYPVKQHKLTLYLQKWDGTKWVDVKSWVFYEYDALSITKSATTGFEHGNYYRARAVHYAKDGTATDTQYSTSTYIYVQ